MKPHIIHCSIAGLVFGVCSMLCGQDNPEEADSTAKSTCVPKTTSQCKVDDTLSSSRYWLFRDASITGGQITLPFKIRPQHENHTFRLTTDVTLGGYIGYTKHLSKKKHHSLTIPLTAGLTFINLNDNNTTLDRSAEDAEVVPGLTWSTGLILQLEQYSLGLMLGKDYASNVGEQWEYHGKLWWSFGIGFVFLK